ncbi:MAG: cytochrome c [Candidatus Nitrohelix vancouverensis]|uniref:Cytochrome c n=1 Tax=Candidatus Nitrohelix vancouverensis TaxID=2705534 RepID=A0A7T0C459_9BACT|nr:MAG: cytochrome c [Candidatus Nitrohelix vancouverensis]
MKRILTISLALAFLTAASSAAWAKSECPQPRKTPSAPGNFTNMDKTSSANASNGEKLYQKTSKPMACAMCHGQKGDGMGKLGSGLKPKPRDFTCADTMKNVSAGQMYWIIKNGSKGTPMTPQKLNDGEIWDVVKYIRESWVK